MILRPKQISELMGIVDYFHILFIGQNIGSSVLSTSDKAILRKFGVDVNTLTGMKMEEAYRFGVLASALKNSSKFKNMDYNDFKKFLKAGGAVPLTQQERAIVDALKQQAYGDIKGLGNRIQQSLNQGIITISHKQRLKMQKVIQESAEEVISNRGNVSQLSSLLGEKSQDWARDFDRIADYVMHSAFQHGIANTLLEKEGEDVEIYYDVYSGACDHCVRVYLTGSIGSEPIVFKLKDVLANGSNIGRKAKDYLPSVDPLHPWCRCTMNKKPENTVWDVNTQTYKLVRNDYGVKRKSKIKITRS